MQQYFDTLQDVSGNALSGATVTVTTYPAGAIASIYSTNGTAAPISGAVVTADSSGQIQFFAPDGAYTLTYANSGTVYKTRTPVQLGDPMSFVTATDSGTAGALIVNSSAYPLTLYVGLKIEVKAAAGNTGAATLNLNSTGAKPITQPGGSALAANQILANGIYRLEYDGTEWQLFGCSSPPYYAQSAQEAAAGVTPVNTSYQVLNVQRYGADPTGVSDSTSAVNSALAVCAATVGVYQGGTVNFGAGQFLLSSGISWTSSNTYIKGQGQGVTILSFSNATGDLVGIGNGVANPNFTGISGLTITASVAKSSGAAVHLQNQTYCYLQDIDLGLNLSAGFQIDGGGVALTYIDRFQVRSGTYPIIIGSSSTQAQEVRISNGSMNFVSGATGITISNASGCYLSRLAVTGNYGVLINPGTGQVVTAVYFDEVISDTCTTYCWLLECTGSGKITDLVFDSCWACSQTLSTGAGFCTAAGGTIQGLTFNGLLAVNNYGQGVVIGAGTKIAFNGCIVGDNSQSGSGTYNGLYINTTDWNVNGGCYGQIDAQFTNLQNYGIYADTGCARYSIIGANVAGNVSSAGILDAAAAGTIVGCPPFTETSSGNVHTVAAGSTTAAYVNTTFDGSIGSTAYTIGDVVAVLKKSGLLSH